jgi:hypothetical protein
MRILLIISFLCNIKNLAAQTEFNQPFKTNGQYLSLLYNDPELSSMQQQKLWVAADNVNLRQTASSQAAVVAVLPVATPVKILSKSDKSFIINGLSAHWFEIQTPTLQKGYIWGGYLSGLYVRAMSDTTLYFMVSLASQVKEKAQAQIRAIRKGQEIARMVFEIHSNIDYNADLENRNMDGAGLEGVNSAINLHTYFPACGYGTSDELIFWTGKTFIHALTTRGEGEMGHSVTQNVLLPQDPGGLLRHVLVVEQTVQMDEDNSKITHQAYKMTFYQWKNQKLMKAFAHEKVLD